MNTVRDSQALRYVAARYNVESELEVNLVLEALACADIGAYDTVLLGRLTAREVVETFELRRFVIRP